MQATRSHDILRCMNTHTHLPLCLVQVLLFSHAPPPAKMGPSFSPLGWERFVPVRAKRGHRDPQGEKVSALRMHYFIDHHNFALQRGTPGSMTPLLTEESLSPPSPLSFSLKGPFLLLACIAFHRLVLGKGKKTTTSSHTLSLPLP